MDDRLDRLMQTIADRSSSSPDESYVASLNAAGLNKILEKVGEEAVETVIAAKDADLAMTGSEGIGAKSAVVSETADLWFHTLVMLNHLGLSHDDVLTELANRFGTSGITEKAAR